MESRRLSAHQMAQPRKEKYSFFSEMKAAITLTIFVLIALTASLAFAKASNRQEGESSRQIVLDRFNKARPPGDAPAAPTSRNRNRGNSIAMRPPVYRRTGSRLPAGPRKSTPESAEELGVTVWRLRPSQKADQGARVLVLDGLKQAAYTPERIEADTPLNIGDRIRLTIESPRPGYLYIVDREQYTDGSLGEAMLIFPTLRTRDGDNRVRPGKLVDIPAQEDQYSYFTAQPAGDRRDQVAELLTIILLPQPLQLPIGEQPQRLSNKQIGEWEKLWGGAVERLELMGGAGRAWTRDEKEASAANGRQLTQSGPPPQTVYRVATKAGGPLLVNVPLRYGK